MIFLRPDIFSGKTLTNIFYDCNFIELKFGQFWPAEWGLRGWRSSMVERLICNQGVAGSSPIASSREDYFSSPERYPSGQRGRAVNPLAQPTEVRILPSPPYPLRVAGSSPVSRSREDYFSSPERCPSGQRGRVVSPLALPTEVRILSLSTISIGVAGIAQWPEHQPSKLRVAGSSPVSRSICFFSPRSSVGRAHPW
jgi:hypothetical protein